MYVPVLSVVIVVCMACNMLLHCYHCSGSFVVFFIAVLLLFFLISMVMHNKVFFLTCVILASGLNLFYLIRL